MDDNYRFDYFYGSQSEQFSFFRLPKVIVRGERFKKLSSDAKILYGIMLDRMSLSRENQWVDQENRVYIIFIIQDTTILPTVKSAIDLSFGLLFVSFMVQGYQDFHFLSWKKSCELSKSPQLHLFFQSEFQLF